MGSTSVYVSTGTRSRAVSDYSSRSSLTPFGGAGGDGLRIPSPFPERYALGRSAAPTYRSSEESFPSNTKTIRTQGPDLMINSSLDDPANFPLCISQWGRRRQEDATGLVRQTPMLETVELLKAPGFTALSQEMALLKAQVAQVSQTASNVQVDLGSKLSAL
ncbi:unnamed protein product [Phytophthora fragariaefolia]|uniref:Unnamed protein product n=1 Tax=Phytophthora fragariaefolia TaxID=1490495 RepID=A0A9W6Y8M8_9STRA|nr:unnamed protein product [Phytophthora fragariaefolia]